MGLIGVWFCVCCLVLFFRLVVCYFGCFAVLHFVEFVLVIRLLPGLCAFWL